MAAFKPDDIRKQLIDAKQLREQAKQQFRSDTQSRRFAEKRDKTDPIFLRPSDISGDYDFNRALTTTLGGGEPRVITKDDLLAMQKNIQTIASNFSGGITIAQTISLSRQVDIDRTNREIHVALPTSRKGGVVTFITNAGPQSQDVNHVVHVEFLSFSSVVLDIEKQKPTTIRNRLSNGKVKIECDCGRFKYWYRYVATLGNFVYGRKEGAFPKIRNPELSGIACKHILRVMQYIRSPIGQQYLSAAVDKDRRKQHGRRYSQNPGEMLEMLDKQVNKIGKLSHAVKAKTDREVKKLNDKAKAMAQRLEQANSRLDEKTRRIARLEANYQAGLIDKKDFDYYMKVENERKY